MSKLIIQRTLNGLDTEYKSEGINEHELEKLGVLYDERKEIIQINQFDWNISITNTATQKVISLIRKGNDRAGRAGFYAIRLLVPKGSIIKGLFNSLQKIAGRYVQCISQSTLNSQDYTDLLNEIDSNTQNSPVILTPTISDKTCYKIVDYNQNLDFVLNDPILELVKKTYLFNQAEGISINTFKEIGFTDIDLLENNLRKIQIENPDNFLTSIIINNTPVSNKNLNETSIQVYVLNAEQVTVKDKFNKSHAINSSPFFLKKPEPNASEYSERNSHRHEKDSFGSTILIGLFCFLIGTAGGYFLQKYYLDPEPNHILPVQLQEQQETASKFDLMVIADKSQSFVLESNESNLIKYTFKYDSNSKSWKVRKRGEVSKDDKLLSQEVLNEIFHGDSSLILVFVEELGKIVPASFSISESMKNSVDSSYQNSTQNNIKSSNKDTSLKKDQTSTTVKNSKPTTATAKENVNNPTLESESNIKESKNTIDGVTKKNENE